ncbi:MAG TPA: class I SAM-dependent methyltransferase [Gammaproteobacteria bacterium]|nr:class I SAM-dependent methyltransferase [Gammaproteobacteria bacterium]
MSSSLIGPDKHTAAPRAAADIVSIADADAVSIKDSGAERKAAAERREEIPGRARSDRLSARLEPFDSYWQAPDDVEKGYSSFYQYYKYNYLPHLPADKAANILVVSCGPGYLVNLLKSAGYVNVVGIDSDEAKVAHARKRGLDCTTARAFEYLADRREEFDAIVPEQELNHLTLDEQLEFLGLCRRSLREGGMVLVYGLNGANPLVASENLSHNIDHFNTFTEHSLRQVLELAGFDEIAVRPLALYVFWKNPLNYVGLAFTGAVELFFRLSYKMYGKRVRVLSKKIAATAVKHAGRGAA